MKKQEEVFIFEQVKTLVLKNAGRGIFDSRFDGS